MTKTRKIRHKGAMTVLGWSQGLSWASMALLIALELRNPRFRDGLFRDAQRARRNQGYLVASLLTMAAFGPWIRMIEPRVPKLFAIHGAPFGVQLLGVFGVAELLNWGIHFLKHRSNFFWKLHFQHHADSEFNLWLSSHTHAGEVLVSGALMSLLIAGLGFSGTAAQIYLSFYSVTTLYQHSSAVSSLGWLDWLIVSPEYHRIHHEEGAQTNYAGRLTLFDVLFGTATWPHPDRQARPLGIGPNPSEPWGFLREFTYFLKPQAATLAASRPLETESLFPLLQEVDASAITPQALPVVLKQGHGLTEFEKVV